MASAAWCLLAAVRPASAQDTIPFQFTLGSEYKVVNITVNGGTTWTNNVAAGRYRGKFDPAGDGFANDTAFNIFCLDASHAESSPFETLVANGYVVSPAEAAQEVVPGKFYYANIFNEGGGLESAMTTNDYFKVAGSAGSGPIAVADRDTAVSILVDDFLNASLTIKDYAAIQLAIWDIIQDGGDGLSVGFFQATTGVSGLLALAESYRMMVDESTDPKRSDPSRLFYAKYIQAPRPDDDPSKLSTHFQEFAFKASAPIPEPAFYQMIALLGLGGVGLRRHLRRRP